MKKSHTRIHWEEQHIGALEDLLKMFHMNNSKPLSVSTLMALNEKLHSNDSIEKVDGRNYRSLVGSLINLIEKCQSRYCISSQSHLQIYE